MSVRPPRVLVTMLQFNPDTPSGASRLAFDEARYVAARGADTWVITQDLLGHRPDYSVVDGIHFLCYRRPAVGRFDPRRSLARRREVSRLLRSHLGALGVDAIHGHSLLEYRAALDVLGSGSFSTYSVHSPVRLEQKAEARGRPLADRTWLAVRGFLWGRLEGRLLDRSDRVTADSAYTKSLIDRVYGPRAGQKTQVIPGWVDLDRYHPVEDRMAVKGRLGWPTDVPVLFTLRRLVPRMGLDRLLAAAGQLAVSGHRFHLVIAGDGHLREQLESSVAAAGLQPHVRFVGRVPDDLLPGMFAAADAFVLPTAELECFGLIALEALASGRPVLATPVAAIPEIVAPVEPRWLAADNTVGAIRQLLSAFLAGALPEHEPAALRAHVAATYSARSVLERLVSVAVPGLSRGPAPSRLA